MKNKEMKLLKPIALSMRILEIVEEAEGLDDYGINFLIDSLEDRIDSLKDLLKRRETDGINGDSTSNLSELDMKALSQLINPFPVIKRFGEDFDSDGGALTLDPSQVTDTDAESGTHTKTHDSGWTITGELQEEYYVWVNEFTATHPELGTVKGNFEKEVRATSDEAFAHFWKHHQPSSWDYGEI